MVAGFGEGGGWEDEKGPGSWRVSGKGAVEGIACLRNRMSFIVPPGVSWNLFPTNKYLFLVSQNIVDEKSITVTKLE